ncbi:MAG: OmpH family outer membrane protein [Cytophagaceae bacterium]|nr:OmpH family outer membrane protein [Cytophagaceae bacterium]MDW8455526.1 OmpH family outer membrane protein [Cytophagaceae bacterium]
MKSFFITISILCCTPLFMWAQKFGYIDSEYIMSKMPEYKKAKQELDKAAEKWQKEIDAAKKELDELKEKFQAEEVLLTAEMRQERLDTIAAREKALREQQKKIFGFEGLLFLKKQELIKPVQDKIFQAVEKVAKAKQLQIVFDKSADLVMIYTNPIHDYSDYVLEELGLGDPNDKPDNQRYNNKY